MTQSAPNNKYTHAADLLEKMLPTYGIYQQTILRAFIEGLRSPDPKAWGRANEQLASPIASVLNIHV